MRWLEGFHLMPGMGGREAGDVRACGSHQVTAMPGNEEGDAEFIGSRRRSGVERTRPRPSRLSTASPLRGSSWVIPAMYAPRGFAGEAQPDGATGDAYE